METKHITKGKWRANVNDGLDNMHVEVKRADGSWKHIAHVYTETHNQPRYDEAQANAELIAEAGTVTNECGLSPRQLLEQRNELLETLRMVTLCSNFNESKSLYGGTKNHWTTIIELAIKKVTE